MKGYEDFKNDLAMRESSDNYRIVNDWGFMGRYQFGKARLWDLGVSIDGYIPAGFTEEDRENKVVLAKECFLCNKELQDKMFRLHVKNALRYIRRKYPDTTYSESSLVAVFHLLGYGGLSDYMKGKDRQDGLGTKASDYAKLFDGYDLSSQ